MHYREKQILIDIGNNRLCLVHTLPSDNNCTYWLQETEGRKEIYVVHRDKVHDRRFYRPMEPYLPEVKECKYERLVMVREVLTGVESIIVGTPLTHRFLKTLTPMYLIRNNDGVVWSVEQTCLESDRYEPLCPD